MPKHYKWLANVMLLLLQLQGCLTDDVMAAEQKRVLILSNPHEQAYLEVVKGFKEFLQTQGMVNMTELDVGTGGSNMLDIAHQMEAAKPDLIFAVGGEALAIAQLSTSHAEIVTTIIRKNSLFNERITGVNLSYPWSLQIQWLKKFLPELRKIAIMYNPLENDVLAQKLKQLFVAAELEMVAIPVESPKQLPDALAQLANNVEVIMAIPDEMVFSSKTAKEVMLASFRNRVPLIGLSDNWVKAGALYALSWDFNDLGRQCALQASKLLAGQRSRQVPPETPRKLLYSINTKIAEHMNISIAENLLQNAKSVFQ